MFQRGVELGVVERDGQVSGDGEQQFHVLAGQKIAVHRLAQAQDGDGVVANAAGNEIVQVQLLERLPDRRRGFSRAARADS